VGDADAVADVAVTAEEPVLGTIIDGEEALALSGDPESRIAELEQKLAEREAELEHVRKGAASSTEVIRIKESKNKAEKEILRLKEELNAKDKELVELQEQQTALEAQAQQLKDDAVKREAAAKALQQRADALAAAAKKFERELTAASEELKAGGGKSQLHRLEAELEKAREEIAALTGEKDLLREERDELRAQLAAAQSSAKQNEDRALRAYQKMKGDDKLRERMRKALQIALALLEEGAVDAGATSEAEKKSA
jgi:chromosome segregation ATPase